jgi:glucose-6-phosphate isomerase
MQEGIDPQDIVLGEFEAAVADRVRQLDESNFVARFWRKDASLWGADAKRQGDVASMLGWVDVLPKIEARLGELDEFVADIKQAGFHRVILAGMGGSSLAPLVFSLCIPGGEGGLPLDVLDSTDPATVQRIEKAGPLDKTLVIVASKSGTTAEPTAFDAYLYDKVGRPENFVAITDPGSPFAKSAEERRFRKIFLNYADIGGRFSALSFFGLVPAALLGLDVREILRQAQALVEANQGKVADSPAFYLGAAIGELAKRGRDKLTFLSTRELSPLGLWMEQLVAESTGKQGTGVLPIAGEEPGPPSVYGVDRVFVAFRPHAGDCTSLDISLAPLRDAGHPIVTVDLTNPYSIAQEMLRFEIATAVVGAVLNINPFDQPNVQESKDVTKRILQTVENEGKLPESPVGLEEGSLRLFGDTCADTVAEAVSIFLSGRQPDDYVAIMAYLPESDELSAGLHRLQREIRDRTRLATTLGYGPRFLHSTGQYHKGGPANGYYLQLTAGHPKDAPIPAHRASWGQFIDAQAMGDMETLKSKDRRVLRIDLGPDPLAALPALQKAVSEGLKG